MYYRLSAFLRGATKLAFYIITTRPPVLLRIAAFLIPLTCAQSSRAALLTLNMPAWGTWTYNTNDPNPPYYNVSGTSEGEGHVGTETLQPGSISWENYFILNLSELGPVKVKARHSGMI
jgi:hypothetical protein